MAEVDVWHTAITEIRHPKWGGRGVGGAGPGYAGGKPLKGLLVQMSVAIETAI